MTRAVTGGDVTELGAAGLISLFGVVLFVPNAARLVGPSGTLPGLVLAAVGALLSAVLVVAGYLLVRAGFAPAHKLRIAGWATLGTVLLGLVLALVSLSGVDLPLFASATLLSVSTFAHVVIGVRDVQRIRAEDLARQREKLAVLNRLVRHNLRHEAQYLLGTKSRIQSGADADELVADVQAVADSLTEMNDVLERTQELVSSDERTTVDLAAVVEAVVAEYREAHPDATIEVDVPADCGVASGDELRTAVSELVENALVHADGAPHVEVTAVDRGDRVTLRVVDDGPGIPEPDRSVIAREVDIDQLTHSQGLGLWFVRWVMDACGGQLRLESNDDGTIVALELPRAQT